MYHLDPSGTFLEYDAKAIGSGSEGAQQNLQDIYHKNMNLKEACKHSLSILKQVMEEKLNATNVEVHTHIIEILIFIQICFSCQLYQLKIRNSICTQKRKLKV